MVGFLVARVPYNTFGARIMDIFVKNIIELNYNETPVENSIKITECFYNCSPCNLPNNPHIRLFVSSLVSRLFCYSFLTEKEN